MGEPQIVVGSRVRLKPHPSWNQPYRGWAERERAGTVEMVFGPAGTKVPRYYKVRFDRQRKTTLSEVFCDGDLLLIEGPRHD